MRYNELKGDIYITNDVTFSRINNENMPNYSGVSG
jgi:hypothetical protein